MVAQVATTPNTCGTDRACWLRAWDRAKAEKLIPFLAAPGVWNVKAYTVTVIGPGWSDLACTCPAGRSGKICKHQAVVAKAIAIGVRPIRPTPSPVSAASDAGLQECYGTIAAA